jgi:hypothetical protein
MCFLHEMATAFTYLDVRVSGKLTSRHMGEQAMHEHSW